MYSAFAQNFFLPVQCTNTWLHVPCIVAHLVVFGIYLLLFNLENPKTENDSNGQIWKYMYVISISKKRIFKNLGFFQLSKFRIFVDWSKEYIRSNCQYWSFLKKNLPHARVMFSKFHMLAWNSNSLFSKLSKLIKIRWNKA